MFDSLFQSKGVKRTIASALALATFASTVVPSLNPYTPLLISIGGGASGIALAHPLVLKLIGFMKLILK